MKLTALLALAGLGLLVIGIAAVRLFRPHASAPVPAAVARRAARARPPHVLQPPLPAARLAALHADETGRIPILMYHGIGGPAFRGVRYDTQGLNIAPETFRKHLELMYAAHWYPVNMRDVLTSHIQVPAGKTPVVLTFDDARGSQFHCLPDGSVDPNCAVGILEAFHQEHPDWPLRATFYVLPKSAWNPVPFWQPGQETKKLRALVADGFEVANHSTTHRPMTHLSGTELTWEMAECQRYVRDRAPQATMDTMALPGGAAPKDHALWNTLLRGHLNNITYRNRCILMAWGGPSRSWADKKFDPDRIARIGTGPGWVERAIKALSTRRIPPYVSDGNPDTVAVPRSEAKFVNPRRLDGARLVVYNDPIASKPKSARRKTSPKTGGKTLVAGKPTGSGA
jgi:peptidoglycan/xylan/chitin deacetylase (PgdA/CDA1 family)